MIVRELSAARNRCWPCTSEWQRQALVRLLVFFFAQMLDVDFGVWASGPIGWGRGCGGITMGEFEFSASLIFTCRLQSVYSWACAFSPLSCNLSRVCFCAVGTNSSHNQVLPHSSSSPQFFVDKLEVWELSLCLLNKTKKSLLLLLLLLFALSAVVKGTDFHSAAASDFNFFFPFQMLSYFNTPQHVFKSHSNEYRGRDVGKDAASLLCGQPSWDLNQHASAARPPWIQEMISLLFLPYWPRNLWGRQNKSPEVWNEQSE